MFNKKASTSTPAPKIAPTSREPATKRACTTRGETHGHSGESTLPRTRAVVMRDVSNGDPLRSRPAHVRARCERRAGRECPRGRGCHDPNQNQATGRR